MNLSDLLVSYKQVNVPNKPLNIQFPQHLNLAQEVDDVTSETPYFETPLETSTSYYISPTAFTPVQTISQSSNQTWKSPYKDRNKWVQELSSAYKKAGITNDNAIKMLVAQDALESNWGQSAQGKFNFGNLTTGAKWKGDYVQGKDHDANGNPIKQKFRSYSSIDQYAADKIQFLKRLYDIDENDNIARFAAKLTGSNKGKRRYAEDRNYGVKLIGVFNSFKKGGIIKADDGTIVPDNTRVVRPTIQAKIRKATPAEHIKSMLDIYGTQEQPQVSSDNRSEWEKEQSQKSAKEAYDQYMQDKKMEEGLHNLNGFLTFTDYATMGLGAGSLLTKGLKWAGKKAIGQVSKQIANSRNMGIVAKPFQKGGFQSELDWSPKSWFEEAGNWKGYTQADIDALASHVPEYHEIERVTKANGTWLKLPNGKTWEGDPRSWVQLMSRDGQKMAMPSKVWKGGKPGNEYYSPYYTGRVWMSDNADVWNSFAYRPEGFYHEQPPGIIYSLTVPKNVKMAVKDAKGKDFISINHDGRDFATDEIVDDMQRKGFNTTTIFNVIEGPHYNKRLNVPTNDFIIHKGTPRKSILGNNGNFDLSNKNIYKGLMPLGITGGIGYGE